MKIDTSEMGGYRGAERPFAIGESSGVNAIDPNVNAISLIYCLVGDIETLARFDRVDAVDLRDLNDLLEEDVNRI